MPLHTERERIQHQQIRLIQRSGTGPPDFYSDKAVRSDKTNNDPAEGLANHVFVMQGPKVMITGNLQSLESRRPDQWHYGIATRPGSGRGRGRRGTFPCVIMVGRCAVISRPAPRLGDWMTGHRRSR